MSRSILPIASAVSPGPNATATGAPSIGAAVPYLASPAPMQIPQDGRAAGSNARSSLDFVACQMMFFLAQSPGEIAAAQSSAADRPPFMAVAHHAIERCP